MRLKSFYATTMTEAMRMVGDELGEDAVIVATREEDGGRAVRVTAAVEQDLSYYDDLADDTDYDLYGDGGFYDDEHNERSDNDWLQHDVESDENEITEKITDVLLRHSVPEEITDQILSCATIVGLPNPGDALIAALEHLFGFQSLPHGRNKNATMLVGPPGCGKTLVAAKLAARGVMDGLNVSLISTDIVRAGAIEQLTSFAKILKIKVHKAADAKELKQCLAQCRDSDQIFIDTGSMNPFEPEEMRDLARLMAAGDIEPLMVAPAGLDPDETGEIARVYAALGVKSMLPTRVDFARRLGGLLSAAHYGGMSFTDASDTPQVADGLTPMSPQSFAEMLMPEMKRRKRNADEIIATDNVVNRKQKENVG
jgi:flagellar biosynthesis protein FlhF